MHNWKHTQVEYKSLLSYWSTYLVGRHWALETKHLEGSSSIRHTSSNGEDQWNFSLVLSTFQILQTHNDLTPLMSRLTFKGTHWTFSPRVVVEGIPGPFRKQDVHFFSLWWRIKKKQSTKSKGLFHRSHNDIPIKQSQSQLITGVACRGKQIPRHETGSVRQHPALRKKHCSTSACFCPTCSSYLPCLAITIKRSRQDA